MKNSNFIKNSMLALLPISLGLTVLFGIKGNSASEVDAYSGVSLPTTIYLNDPTESTIRGYYSNLNSLSASERKGDNLLKNLKTILSNGQKYYNYDSGDLVWKMYEITDRDWDKSPASSTTYGTYNVSTNTITNYQYGSNSSSKNNPFIRAYYMDRDQTNVVCAWGNHNQDGTGINREHLWAKAEGFDGSDGAAAGARGDPMHLVAANGYANNIHSNNFYGYVDKTKSYTDVKDKYSTLGHNYKGKSQTVPSSNIDVFEPQDCDKGDIARAIFYMAARYNNIAGKSASQEQFDADNPNLLLTNDLSKWKSSGYTSTATNPGYHGLISDLLEWNRIDPPDEYEIHRNNLLYTNFTNNRNPFIDFPNWADICWGDQATAADPVSDALNGKGSTKTIKSISITSQPSKSVYQEGESFSTAGMVVTAKYSDNSTETITNYTYSPSGALSLGTDKITVSYQGKNAEVSINVVQQGTQLIRYFEKVESGLTSGNYLIVSDANGVAWKTGVSGSANAVSVAYDDNENIVYTAELGNALFTFDLEEGSIFAPNDKYIYQDADVSGVKFSETPVRNTISLSNGILTVQGSAGAKLRCNQNIQSGVPKPTFNFYKSNSTYDDINIYRLIERVEDIHPASITVSPATATLEVGSSRTLMTSVLPLDATDKSVTWSSNQNTIATVDENGRVVAKSAGTAIITATSNDLSSVYGTCTITVPEPVSLNRIEVTGSYQTSYYVNDEFNPAGIVVNAIYTQGGSVVDTIDVTDETEFTGFDSSSAGVSTVTATYENFIDTFEVTIENIPVEEDTIVVVPSSLGYENATTISKIEQDDYSIEFESNGGTSTKYYTNGSAIRAYAKNKFTISGPYKITKVVLVFGSSDGQNEITPNTGSYNSGTGVWTSVGADKVTFTIGGDSGNRRLSEIRITYDSSTPASKELTSISLSGDYKTIFDVDDAFDSTGLVVTAHYNDGSSSEITPDSITGANMSVSGEQEITVSYTENSITKTATYTIVVNEVIILTGIELSGTQPTNFFVGDPFDRTNLIVTASYSDGNHSVVSPSAVTGYNMNNAGTQEVTVYYTENNIEVSATYTITINEILPESLKVSNIEQTEYVVGDAFNDNLTATVTYNNGSTQVVTPTSFSGNEMDVSGEHEVVVEYIEKNVSVYDSYKIQIDNLKPVSLEISGDFCTEFFVGDTFTYDGLVATVTYNNGESEEVVPEVSSPDMSSAGTKEITVSYTLNEVTVFDTYDITVTAVVPTKIELSGSYKTSYFVGETFTSEGLVVTATYNNGDVEEVSPTNISTPAIDSAGNEDVTVTYTYGGTSVYASYTISVTQVIPTSIVVSGYKSSFFVGDTFSLGDISLEVTYNNGSKGTKTPTSYDAPDLSSDGTKQVKVYYSENGATVSTTYNVTVNKVLPSELAISGTYETSFNVGDTFTHEGLVATVKFNNGSEREVTPTFSTPDMSTKGTKAVTVSYTQNGETASATYNITVNAIVHSVTLDETNLSIDLHDAAEKTLTATVNADAGAQYELEWSVADQSVLSISESGNSVSITPHKVGSTTIKVEAGGKYSTCTVDVTSLVSSIKISGENTVILGENIQLSATVLPNDASASEVEWSSTDPSILAIAPNGNTVTVTAVGTSGQKATITASAKDGSGKSDSIEITIVSIESIRIDYSGINNDNKVSFAQYKSNQDVNAKVTAVWTDGSITDVTELATKDFKINCLQLGEQEISASYAGFSATLTLKVTNEGSENYVGINSKSQVTRAGGEYNATPLQQAEAWADYFVKLTGGGEYDGPCKLPADERQKALEEVWDELNNEYGFMTDASKDEFCNTSATSTKIVDAMNHYKYVCKTYSMSQFVEDSHQVKPTISNSPIWVKQVKNISIITGVILGIVGIVVLIIFVTVKKRKRA